MWGKKYIQSGWEATRRYIYEVEKVTEKRVYTKEYSQLLDVNNKWQCTRWSVEHKFYPKKDWFNKVKRLQELED